MVLGSIVAFVVALLVGGLAIYISASVVMDVQDYSHAVVTALVGAIAWGLTAWIPLFGPILALIVWVGVVNWRYPGSWVDAAIIGVVAWLAALALLFAVNAVLGPVLGFSVGAFGVPGA
ncbi:hypothetical protein [Halalkalicoccus subterraneus]|uniref:hypothetical protein n=1 Tax=Halalkalicoccus subterraneus TaxID=2675002 RepID=UPI000EFB4301|nr:hypothetical protein [Halalkalicoccus subterraneus]